MTEEVIEKKRSGRNWKWSLSAFGCLSIIVATIVTIFLLYGAIETKVTAMFKNSVPYVTGMETLTNNTLVKETLGVPIETTESIQGSINNENDKLSTADLKIPVNGPKGEATLLIIAEKKGADWTYQTMQVTFEKSNEIIDLLPSLKE